MPGYFQNKSEQTSCYRAPQDWYTAEAGSAEALPCAFYHYTQTDAQQSCLACGDAQILFGLQRFESCSGYAILFGIGGVLLLCCLCAVFNCISGEGGGGTTIVQFSKMPNGSFDR